MLAWLAAARAVHFAATATLMGAVLFQYLVAEPAFGVAAIEGSPGVRVYRAGLAIILWIGLALAALSGAAWLLALAAKLGDGVAWVLLTETRFGHLWIVRALLAVLLFCALWLGRPRALTVVTAILLMGSLAGSGHAAGSPGAIGDMHLVADVLHLIAAAAWLGGLLPLLLLFGLAMRQADPALASILPAATRRFSTLGLISVGTLLVTGLVNTWMLAGGLPTVLATTYGSLLLLKIALFVAIVAIAGINRSRLMPRLPKTDIVYRLDRNARVELALGLAIIAIVSVLGVLSPAAHTGMPMH